MKLYLIYFFILIASFFEANAQVDSIYHIKHSIIYHPNGNIKTIQSFLLDSCKIYIPEILDYDYVDTCRYGIYKEYYLSGVIKTVGQYDCKLWKPKRIGENYFEYNEEDCFKSGIWYEFDTLGKVCKMIRYLLGAELFHRKYPINIDTVRADRDVNIIAFTEYDLTKGNSYLIKRTNKNVKILLDFPLLTDHNYWHVFGRPLDVIDDYRIYTRDFWKDRLFFLANDDTSYKPQAYMNMSSLPDGRYYIYYMKGVHLGYFYEVEVILESVN